jgi:A118 family predicted phage portal protein
MDLYESIQSYYSNRGINVVTGTIRQKIEEWKSWYRGNVNNFHTYKENIQGTECVLERLTLNLPKKICEDLANLSWNEDSNIYSAKEEYDEILQNILEEENFTEMCKDFFEGVFWSGSGATIQYVKNGNVTIDFLSPEHFLITDYHNKKVNGIITISQTIKVEKEKEYTLTHLVHHHYDKTTYRIMHRLFKYESANNSSKNNNGMLGNEVPLNYIFSETELANMQTFKFNDDNCVGFEIETDTPHFQYYTTALKNSWDTNSPYGMSQFATSLDSFKKCDIAFDVLNNEIDNGKMLIFVDTELTTELVSPLQNGEIRTISYLDKNKSIFVGIPGMAKKSDGSVGKAIEVFAPQLRTEAMNSNLTQSIRQTGWKCGLGKNYFEMVGGQVTATQVIHSDSEVWRSVVAFQNGVLKQFKKLGAAVINCYNYITSTKNQWVDIDSEIQVNFDDSIIIDDEKEKENVLILVNEGFLPKWKFLMKHENMSEEEAKECVMSAALEHQAIENVKYPDEDEEDIPLMDQEGEDNDDSIEE